MTRPICSPVPPRAASLLLLLLAGCVRAYSGPGDARPSAEDVLVADWTRETAPPDTAPRDAGSPDAVSPFGQGSWLLGPVQKLGTTVNTTANHEASPWLTPDGKTLYFARRPFASTGSEWTLYRASRGPSGSFGAATPLTLLNAQGDTFSISMSGDELHAVVTADWSGAGNGATDLWVGQRSSANEAWTPLHFVPATAVNSSLADVDGMLDWAGLQLHFAVVGTDPVNKTDLYRTERAQPADAFDAPQAITELNSGYRDDSPAPSPDGQVLVFCSNRPGGSGGEDLWWARRTASGTFDTPQPMPVVNTAADERETFISFDGRELLFASDRPAGGNTQWDLYRVAILQGP